MKIWWTTKDQILKRTQEEADANWARYAPPIPLPKEELAQYYQQIGRNYLKSKRRWWKQLSLK